MNKIGRVVDQVAFDGVRFAVHPIERAQMQAVDQLRVIIMSGRGFLANETTTGECHTGEAGTQGILLELFLQPGAQAYDQDVRFTAADVCLNARGLRRVEIAVVMTGDNQRRVASLDLVDEQVQFGLPGTDKNRGACLVSRRN